MLVQRQLKVPIREEAAAVFDLAIVQAAKRKFNDERVGFYLPRGKQGGQRQIELP